VTRAAHSLAGLLGVVAVAGIGYASPATHVDMALVLAVDVSASISTREQRLQRQGYVAAFRSPGVIEAIRSGPIGRIVVAYVEWSGPSHQTITLPWTLVDGSESAEDLASRLEAQPLSREFDTSIAGAIAFSAELLASIPFSANRKVIDISSNGPNNTGPPVVPARDAVLAKGITVNGLPVMVKISWSGGLYSIAGLDFYFEDCVIGGPGAFVVAVKHADEFKRAIERKLVLEIADRSGIVQLAALHKRPERMDCLAGEKNSGRLLPVE
jgi:hypothetical protein